jgi:hypothetical protein
MRLKCRLNFIEPWSTIIPDVAKQCGLSVEEYCRRAVQVITRQGLEDVEIGDDGKPEVEGGSDAREGLLHDTGTSEEVPQLQDTNSDALPNQNNA